MRTSAGALPLLWIVLGAALPALGGETWFDDESAGDHFVADTLPCEVPTTTAAPCIGELPCDATASQGTGHAASPYDGPLCTRAALSGNWGGFRDSLAGDGVTFWGDLTQYYQGVASGGSAQRFVYGGRGDYLIDLNTEKLGLWKGGFLDLRGETRLGQDTNGIDGTVSPTNIGMLFPYPNRDVTALTGVQYTQALSEELLVFAGKLNVFDGTPTTYAQGKRLNRFSNAALAFNLAAILVPPSTLGAGFTTLKDGEQEFLFMVLDPHYTPTTSGFEKFFDNGVLLFGEYQIKTPWFGLPGHNAVGFVYSNASRLSLASNWWLTLPVAPGPLPRVSDTWTLTYRFDQVVYERKSNPKQTWLLEGQAGLSDGDANPAQWFVSLGLTGTGWIESRPADTFGVGYYHLGITDKGPLPVLGFGGEDGVELYYNVAVTPWFHVTPDFQVIDPSNSRTDTSVLVGLRARLTF